MTRPRFLHLHELRGQKSAECSIRGTECFLHGDVGEAVVSCEDLS